MQRYTTTCGLQFDYVLKYSRRKTIGFHIRPHGLEIRAPRNLRQRQLERAIESKKAWLKNNLHALEMRQQRWLEPSEVWREQGLFPFMGAPIKIAFAHLPQPQAEYLEGYPQRLFIPPGNSTDEVYNHCKSWLQDQARQHLANRLKWWAEKHKISYRRFTLGWSKRTWGWCKSDGAIMLNWRLIYYPLHLIDYVATHELTHITHMHHGPEFWQTLGKIYPNYQIAKTELSLYHPACVPNFISQESS
ncbi:MAG TPA: SprT family zinc-dependent metalloprotease [Paenalcaligenes sp.]|nr:SprT family zinc-dependent metalloprotease [Paenalcaligenes sp.]